MDMIGQEENRLWGGHFSDKFSKMKQKTPRLSLFGPAEVLATHHWGFTVQQDV